MPHATHTNTHHPMHPSPVSHAFRTCWVGQSVNIDVSPPGGDNIGNLCFREQPTPRHKRSNRQRRQHTTSATGLAPRRDVDVRCGLVHDAPQLILDGQLRKGEGKSCGQTRATRLQLHVRRVQSRSQHACREQVSKSTHQPRYGLERHNGDSQGS
jgi:hypothetical protein